MSLRRLLLVLEPGRDGVFDYVDALVAYLEECHPGVAIDLAYSSVREGPGLPRLVERIRARGGRAVDLRVGNAPRPGDFRAAREIVRLARAGRPQLVHAHSSKAGALCRILRAAVPGFPPVVYTPHAYYGLGGGRSAATLLFNTLESVFGRIGHTVNVSFDERAFALERLRLPRHRLVLIINGVDLRRFHPEPGANRRRLRSELNLPAEDLVLVSVGRDSAQKHYLPLYRALDPILADPACRLFFVHAGAGSEHLEQTLSPAAQRRSLAFEHLDHVERLVDAADAFILTSRYEGLALSALQALAAGLKTFLTRVTGNANLDRVGFHEIAWIEPSEDEAELAARIERALRAWLARPVPPGPEQVAVARTAISNRIQFEKLCRLYDHLASGGTAEGWTAEAAP